MVCFERVRLTETNASVFRTKKKKKKIIENNVRI